MDATRITRKRAAPVAAVAPRSQRGQAMVFVLGFAASLAAAFLISYGAGERLAAKQRLLDAADAAAFGGATWQARTLNFQAYANRAIVANEVALAQAVSLRAWSDHMARTLTNVDMVTRYLPYLGQATAAARQGWASIDAGLQPAMLAVETASITANQILAAAQPAVHAFGFVAAEQVAQETLRSYGPSTALSTGGAALVARNGLEWQRYTETYAGERRARLRDVVLRGRDGFTRERNFRLSPPVAGLLVRFEKRGGTELVGFDTWRAVDTLALHQRNGFLFGRFRESVPIGWGAAQNAVRPNRWRGDHGGAWSVNPRTARLADARLPARTQRVYPGLVATRDVAPPLRPEPRELRFAVEAADAALDPIADPARTRVSRVAAASLQPSRSAASQYALAAAAVRFERPEPRADRRREYPSLYNPYWQARLVGPASGERTLAAASRGVVDPYAGLAP
jgi:hypothetical protein